jgi:hypothetical protein
MNDAVETSEQTEISAALGHEGRITNPLLRGIVESHF